MQIVIQEIVGKDLKDTGNRFDAQDPCVVIQVGKSSIETPRQEDAGTFFKYTDQFILSNISEADIQNQEIIVEVFNKSVIGMKTHVGKGSLPVKDLFPVRNQPTQITIPLLYKNKEKKGTVTLSATLVDPNNAPPATATPSATPAPAPSIEEAAPKQDKNAENVLVAPGKDTDPAKPTPSSADISAAPDKDADRSKQNPKTSGESKNETPATTDEKVTPLAEKDKLKPTKSTRPEDKPLDTATPVSDEKESGRERKKDSGLSKVEQKPSLETQLSTAILHIKSISAQGLPNVELRGENDPFAILTFGNWNFTTAVQEEAGSNVLWEYSPTDPAMQFQVTPEVLKSQELNVKVWDKNDILSNTFIGEGSGSLQSTLQQALGSDVVVTISLINKKKKAAGVVTITCSLEDPAKKVSADAPKKEAAAAPVATEPPKKEKKQDEVAAELLQKEKKQEAAVESSQKSQNVANEKDIKPKEVDPSPTILHIKSISAQGLPNVELRGENDPFAILTFGNWNFTTAVQEETGSNVLWEYSPTDPAMQFQVTPEVLKSQELNVKVWDKNDILSNTFIGEGSGSLQSTLQQALGSDVVVTISLINKKKKAAGVVTITCSLEDPAKKVSADAPKKEAAAAPVAIEPPKKETKQEAAAEPSNTDIEANRQSGKEKKSRFAVSTLRFKEISVSGLPNVERFGGENDPFVILKFGEKWTATTTAQEEAGSAATWEYQSDNSQMYFDVLASDLRSWKLNAEVWDKNTTLSNVLIGVGETSLETALTIAEGEDVRISFPITNKKGKASGSVTLVFTLTEKPEPSESDSQKKATGAPDAAAAPIEPFTLGTLYINRIKCFQLRNVELVGENDPYVIVSLGSWSDRTIVLEDVGANPLWDNLDMKIDGITNDIIDSEVISVTVMDKNSARSDVLIGKGTVSPARAYETLRPENPEIDLIVNLLDEKGQKKVGKVVLYVTLQRYKPKSSLLVEITEKLKVGTLFIQRIRAKNIKNVEIMGKSDPYCVMKYGTTTLRTVAIDGGGSTVCWDHLDLQIPNITKEILINELLLFELWDSNTINSDQLIGKHQVSLRCVGGSLDEINYLEFDLTDKKGRPAGHIVLDIMLKDGIDLPDNQIDSKMFPIPSTFTRGRAYIKMICVFDAKNTEWVGKQDLYTVLKYGPWSEMTSIKSNEGSAVIWKNLDLAFDVTLESLQSHQLKVSLYDENTIRSDVLLGEVDVSLLRAVHHFGEEVTLKFALPSDQKGKCPGRFTITMIIEEPLPAVPEIDPSFSSGCIVISKAIVSEMKPSKNQFLKICFLPNKSNILSTEESNDLVWDFLSVKAHMTRELLSQGEVYVELYSKGFLGQKLIAVGQEGIQLLGQKVGENQDLRFQLYPPDREGHATTNEKPLGWMTLTGTVKNESVNAAEQVVPPPKQIPLPDDFIDGMLYITYIQVFGLKNTELIGKSDPFVKFQLDSTLGNNEFQTNSLQNSGGDVIWDDVKLKFKVSYDDILAGKPLEVSVWDENSIRKNICVGSGKASLRRFASQLKNEIEVSIDIHETDKSEPSGRVVIRGELKEMEAQVVSQLPESFTNGILCIKKICVHEMKNIELIGLPDPYVKIKTIKLPYPTSSSSGSTSGQQESSVTWSERTYTQENIGCNPVWNYLDFFFPVTVSFLQNEGLEFQVWEENTLIDDLVGVGYTDLQAVNTLNQDIEIKFPILDTKKKPAGRMSIILELRLPQPKEIEISPEFTSGMFFIRRITAYGLHSTEFFGKGDPYLKLKLGNWSGETNVMANKGDNIIWDYLDMSCELTLEQLKNEKLQISAFDKNTLRADALIGSGEVKIIKAGVTLKKEIELSLELLDAKGKTTGRIVCYVMLQEGYEPDESSLTVPPTFQFGTLSFQKIRSFNLKNTEIFGLQDPYVVLKIGSDWSEKTYTKEEGGGDVLWEYLDLQCDLTNEMIHNEVLTVEVWDENKGRKDCLIGTATSKLLKPGAYLDQEVELHLQLLDEKNQNSGRLVIYCTLKNENDEDNDGEGVVDPSFMRGELRIKRITGFNLKNTELMGRQDPYIELLIPDYDYKQKTPVLDEIGSNPIWDHLDYSLVVKSNLIKVGCILVKVWDKNTATSDTLIGSAEILLRKAGCNLDKDVELRGKIYDPKGIVTGRLVILANLHALPPEAADSEIILPEDFTSGIVSFNRIQLKGLKNREILGDQDPYVRLELSAWSGRTTTLSNVGKAAIWQNITDLVVEVDRGILLESKLRVIVMDENQFRKHSLLGAGSISLRRLGPRINNEVELTVDLQDNGVAMGQAIIGATLRPARIEEVTETISEDQITLQRGVLMIKSVTAKDMKGGDSGPFDKQDLYVILELRDWIWRTPFQNNSGSSASWRDLDGVVTDINGDTLKLERLKVSVWDKNTLSDTVLGRGTVSLRKAGTTLDTDVSMTVPVKDKFGQTTGEVTIVLQVQDSSVPKENEEGQGQDAIPTTGLFEIQEIHLNNLRNTEFFGKSDPYVKLSIGTNWKYTSDVKMNGGANVSWTNLNISKQFATSQISRDELKVVVFDKNSSRKDVELGAGSVTIRSALSSPQTWVNLRGDLFSGKQSYGQFQVKGRFIVNSKQPYAGDHATPVEDPQKASKSQAEDLKKIMEMQNQVDKKMGGMEDTLKQQMQKDMDRERRKMEEMLSSQNQKLDETLRKLATLQQTTSTQPAEPLKPWHGMSISEINAIKLPLDITTWRTAHVQAWLSLQMDLPQYLQAFYDASIDGLVLLKHINAEILEEAVGVTIPLHRLKILEGIEALKKRQSEYERKKKESQKPPPQPQVVEDPPPKKEKTKKPKPKASQTIFGDVKEHNELEAIRLKRIMQEKRKQEKQKQKRLSEQNELWKFEYTGGKKPSEEQQQDEVISNILLGQPTGSSKYEKMMKNIFETTDLLPPQEGEQNSSQKMNSLKLRQIPIDSPYDEVLAITRAAMYEVSTRLLQIYNIEKMKELKQNADMNPTGGNRYGDDIIEQTIKGTHDMTSSQDDLSIPPPVYTETIEDDEDEGELPQYPTEEYDQATLQTMIPPISRSQLIFSAFINQKNNDARWLGPNSKLTRLKFHGGFESVLRLKISWPQFDALWTKLDYRRSGELDEEEFTTFFGDFEEFEPADNLRTTTSTGGTHALRLKNQSLDQFTSIMYEVCQIFRKNEFTINEIFKSFDRNGSGMVSISEFHSFLRIILGTNHRMTVKDMYRIFSYLDRDNSRTISCHEISMFVYLIWRNQLRDLAYQISTLDVDNDEDRVLINKILRERNEIKEAIKKNFSREWRDYFERINDEQNDALANGPFGHILKKLGVTIGEKSGSPTNTMTSGPMMSNQIPAPPSPFTRSPQRPLPPRKGNQNRPASAGTGGKHPSGKNDLLKYRLQSAQTQQIPTRKGATLTVPPTHILGDGREILPEGNAIRYLQQTNPVGNQVFSMTSKL